MLGVLTLIVVTIAIKGEKLLATITITAMRGEKLLALGVLLIIAARRGKNLLIVLLATTAITVTNTK